MGEVVGGVCVLSSLFSSWEGSGTDSLLSLLTVHGKNLRLSLRIENRTSTPVEEKRIRTQKFNLEK